MPAALTITGNTNDALAAIAKLERQYDSLENKLKRLNGESRQSGAGWSESLDAVATKYLSIASVVGTIGSAVRATVAENTKLLDQLDEFVAKNSQTSIKLQIQGAMTSPEVRAMMPGMEKSLMATPSATMDQSMKIQTQLASSGFAGADVKSGEALKAMLDIKAATNQFGESIGDEAEAAKSMSMLLKAGGSANPSAKEMRELGGSIVSLFETSDVQFQDFKQLAPKISGLKNFGLSMEESIATFSALTDVMGGNKADTGLAQFVARTSTTAAFPERAQLLQSIGLKPSDLAMSPGGKGLTETVDLLKSKLGTLGEEDRNNFIAKLYGEEAGPSASYLLSDSGSAKMKEYIETAENKKPFERNVEAFQNSRYATNARMGIAKDFSLARIDMGTGEKTWAELKAENEANALQQNVGVGPGQRLMNNFGTTVENAATSIPYYLGLTPTEAGLGGAGISDQVRKQSQAETDKQLQVLEEIRDGVKQEKKRPLNANGQVEGR